MGFAVMLVVLLVGPTAYAQLSGCPFSIMLEQFVHQIDAFLGGENEMKTIQNSQGAHTKYWTGYTEDVYVPKSPRRPIIMVWPSVMNPDVTKEVAKEIEQRHKKREYLKIECNKDSNAKVQPITWNEIRNAIDPFDESHKAPTFFGRFVPKLILWLSGEALECGFYTIFKREQDHIYRFIAANRLMWIKALQEVVYILIKTIAVIHHKTNRFQTGPVYGSLNWLQNWAESYEHWFQNYLEPEKYFETFILNSLDIVMAWLFDYLAERTKPTQKRRSKPFWTFSNVSKWRLSDDRDIVCALENYDMVPAFGWEFVLDRFDDKMKIMADTFLKCEVMEGCQYRGPVQIFIGDKGSNTILRTPSPKDCILSCNALPKVTESASKYAYSHAHMTTAVAHELYCNITSASIYTNYETSKKEVTTECYPLIVETYIKERQYKICKSVRCRLPCCRPIHDRPHPHCEIVTNTMAIPEYTPTSNTTLTKDMMEFPDLKYLR